MAGMPSRPPLPPHLAPPPPQQQPQQHPPWAPQRPPRGPQPMQGFPRRFGLQHPPHHQPLAPRPFRPQGCPWIPMYAQQGRPPMQPFSLPPRPPSPHQEQQQQQQQQQQQDPHLQRLIQLLEPIQHQHMQPAPATPPPPTHFQHGHHPTPPFSLPPGPQSQYQQQPAAPTFLTTTPPPPQQQQQPQLYFSPVTPATTRPRSASSPGSPPASPMSSPASPVYSPSSPQHPVSAMSALQGSMAPVLSSASPALAAPSSFSSSSSSSSSSVEASPGSSPFCSPLTSRASPTPPPPPQYTPTPPSSPSPLVPSHMANFSMLWGDQRLADVVIQVNISAAPRRQGGGEALRLLGERPTKRAKQDGEGPGEEVSVSVPAATLRVHGVVLAQRSAYFEGMLLGAGTAMVEGQSKTLTVEVADAQEVLDFQRLIKLSYLPSYTNDNGRRLGKEELMRLLVMADRFGMAWCVEECAAAVRPFRNYYEAVAYFRIMPDPLLLQCKALIATTKAAGDVLAEALGPVEELFQPADEDKPSWGDGSGCCTLDERVVALPINAIEALLRSERLQLSSENYAFSLALWWVFAQPGTVDKRQHMCSRLLKSLRYACMSASFLASIVQIPWVKESGMAVAILQRGLWRRDNVPTAHPTSFPSSRVEEDCRESYMVAIKTRFTKAALEAVNQPGDTAEAPLGLLHGFPCFLQMTMEEGGFVAFAVLSNFLRAKNDALDTPGEGGSDWGGHDDDADRGFDFEVRWGYIGGVKLKQDKMYETRVGGADAILRCRCSALDDDEEGDVRVNLELVVYQQMGC